MRKLILVTSLCLCNMAFAGKLIEVSKVGPTIPVSSQYMENKPPEKTKRRDIPTFKQMLVNKLPVTSNKMKPGYFEAVSHKYRTIFTPIFIIGSDAYSKRWIVDRKNELLKFGAHGVLVQAATEADLKSIAELVAPLKLSISQGDELADIYGITRYPVLIHNGGIEQ